MNEGFSFELHQVILESACGFFENLLGTIPPEHREEMNEEKNVFSLEISPAEYEIIEDLFYYCNISKINSENFLMCLMTADKVFKKKLI